VKFSDIVRDESNILACDNVLCVKHNQLVDNSVHSATDAPPKSTATKTEITKKPIKAVSNYSRVPDSSPSNAVDSVNTADEVELSTNENNDSGFVTVRRRNKPRKKSFIVRGNNIEDKENAFGVPRRAWFYLSRIKVGTTSSQIVTYLKSRFSEHEFSCEELSPNETGRSFKLGTDYSLLKEMYQKATWPNGVTVSRFMFKRNLSTLGDFRASTVNSGTSQEIVDKRAATVSNVRRIPVNTESYNTRSKSK
jgi:hypothetical protein